MQGKEGRTSAGVSDGSCGSGQDESGDVSHSGKMACSELFAGSIDLGIVDAMNSGILGRFGGAFYIFSRVTPGPKIQSPVHCRTFAGRRITRVLLLWHDLHASLCCGKLLYQQVQLAKTARNVCA
jgi:hypothetical protein